MEKKLLNKLIASASIFGVVGITTLIIGVTNNTETINPGKGSDTEKQTEEVSVDHIAVTQLPNKLNYNEFEMLDTTGLEVTAYYTDNTSKVLKTEDYIIDLKDPLIPTNNFVTITEKSDAKDCNFQITVNSAGEILSEPQLWVEAEYCNFETINSLDCGSACKLIEGASGDIVLQRFGINSGNKLTMKVNSSVAGKTKVCMKICSRKSATKFEDMYSMYVNDIKYPVKANIDAAASEFQLFDFTSFIYLQEGTNTVRLESISENGANLDAFGFASDKAIITDGGTVPTIKHSLNGPYIKVKPTEETTGVWSDGCPNCGYHSTGDYELPIITDPAYSLTNGVYSITVDGGHTLTFGTKIHKFECEDMQLLDPNGGSYTKSAKVTSKDNASGGSCLYKMNTVGNKIVLVVESSQTETVDMTVCVAARVNQNGKCFTVTFAEMYTVEVNGSVVPTTVAVTPNKPSTVTNDYFEFHAINIGRVNLVQGVNTIVLTVSNKDGNAVNGNLDYIELTTGVADLTEIPPTSQE